MAQKMINATKLEACCTAEANAIREHTGESSLIAYDWENSKGFSDAIRAISGGTTPTGTLNINLNGTYDVTDYAEANVAVGEYTGLPCASDNDVVFIDYDGEIRYSYSAAEFAQLEQLPPNPIHAGLTAQGWNWALADAKTLVAKYGYAVIGQNYITSDGKTRIYIHLVEEALSPYLGMYISGSVIVDWGDGSSEQTITGGTSASVNVHTQHNYLLPGDYTITIRPVSSSTFYFRSTYTKASTVLHADKATSNENARYRNAIKKIELGQSVSLSEYAFYSCSNLTSITMPSAVSVPSMYIFASCKNLSGLVIGSGTSLSANTFNVMTKAKYISIPNTITQFGNSSFASSGIYLPPLTNNMSSIGTQVFNSCQYLTKFNFPDTLTSITDSFCNSLNCIQKIVIPSNVTSIGKSIFSSWTSLGSITIPSKVTSIGTTAFQYCYSLTYIRFEPKDAPAIANANAFTSLPTDCIIYYPFAGLDSYIGGTNYPSQATYTYIGFATYESGETLPTLDSSENYNVIWYATKADAIAELNAITTGTGNEIYCRHTSAA